MNHRLLINSLYEMKIRPIILLLFALVQLSLNAVAKGNVTPLSPLSYGLSEATTGIERFRALERCHKDAVKKNASISYSGIESLDIEIPADAASIPLPDEVDFAGVQLKVLNIRKNFTLFLKSASATPVQVSAEAIDSGRFNDVPELCEGLMVLIIEDKNPWVENRKGYSYGAVRKDVLVVKNGLAENSVTSPYSNKHSSPKTSFVPAGSPKAYRNLKFSRDSRSTKITYLFSINGCYDVTISDVTVLTPQDNDLYGDAAIQVHNSAKVRMSDVRIDGTYSQTNHYGYGINLENVSFYTGERLYARARWGVFGSNNVNGAVLRDCDINRFDIHCYGKDVHCYNCWFSGMYNQFSSVFGEVFFEKCSFTNFIPVLMESSYNAYTPFDLTFKNCTFNLSASRNYLVTLFGLEEAHNSRPELSRKSLPNISIRNCTVNLADDVKKWYIVNTGKVTYKETLDYINRIEINGLKINGKVDYKIFSSKIKTTEPLNLIARGAKMIGNENYDRK